VVRVHRQHRFLPSWIRIGLGLVGLGMAVAVLLRIIQSPLWRLPVLLVVVSLVVFAILMHTGPVPNGEGGYWYAVTEKGLLVWMRDVHKAVAVPWSAVEVAPPWNASDPRHLRWTDPERGRRMPVANVCGGRDLVWAVRRGRPAPSWTARRVLGLASGGVVIAVAVWFAGVPVVTSSWASGPPSSQISHDFVTAAARTAERRRMAVLARIRLRFSGTMAYTIASTSARPATPATGRLILSRTRCNWSRAATRSVVRHSRCCRPAPIQAATR
jgi:hypothetical protein